MFTKKIPAYISIVALLLGGVVAYCTTKIITPAQTVDVNVTKEQPACNVEFVHLRGYKYVDPILYAEKDCESKELESLNQEINSYIENEKKSGKLTSTSVYIRTLKDGEWTDINPGEQYHPASLLKMPVLFTFAKMAETNPAILNEKILYKQHDATLPTQMFPSKTLVSGHTYTIKELLHYLIAYSDNDALYLLYNYHNEAVYEKVFSDLGVQMPQPGKDASITVKEYSVFLEVLYSGTYLSLASSEFALSYLAESDFKEGILKGLPPSAMVAHKFGEYFKGNNYELHESAIVYLGGKKDYLITVMTKGTDMKELSDVLGNVSHIVYNSISAN